MLNKTSGRVALCGVLAALMLVVMLFGTMIPLSTYACPALAGEISIPVISDMASSISMILYPTFLQFLLAASMISWSLISNEAISTASITLYLGLLGSE